MTGSIVHHPHSTRKEYNKVTMSMCGLGQVKQIETGMISVNDMVFIIHYLCKVKIKVMYINNIDIKMIMKLGRSIYIPWYRCKPDNESRVDLNQDSKGQGPDNRNILLHVHIVCHTVEQGHLRDQIGSNRIE